MGSKLDIMNMRSGEEWVLVDGKERRVEKNIIVADTVDKEAVEVIKKAAKKVEKKEAEKSKKKKKA